MSVNPSSPFSINISKLLGEDSQFFQTSVQPTIETPSFLEPEKSSNLNPNDAAAAKLGIAVNTQRTRLISSNTPEDQLQYQPSKLTGKDGKVYTRTITDVADDERFGVLVENIGKDDSRETILFKAYEATAKAAGYSEADAARIANVVVEENKQQADVNIYKPETKEARDKTYLDGLRSSGQMKFGVTGANLKHFERVYNQKFVVADLAKGKVPSDELLQKAGIDRAKLNEMIKDSGWQPIPTFDEAVNKLAAEKKAAVLARREKHNNSSVNDTGYTNSKYYGMTDAQLTTETKREATVDIRRAIGKGELQVRSDDQPATISPYTPTLADRVRPLIEKYMPGLAALNTPEGIKTTNIEAFAASYVNARLFGATDFYVDKSRFHSQGQQSEAAAFAMAGSVVGELQNLTAAGKTVGAAMTTPRVAKAMTALRESGVAGKILAQTLPAATTFGGLETAKKTVQAATGNGQETASAVTDIAKATATGAVFGVFQPLGVGVRVPAVVAGSYGVEKVFGTPDKQAAISALTNGLFAIAGGHGNIEQLNGKTIRITGENATAANVRVTVDTGRRIVLTEVFASAKADLVVGLPKLREAARVNILNETVPLSKEGGGAIFRTTGDKPGELKYLQTMWTRDGIVLKPLTAEQYGQAKGTVPELEISTRQFEAANGVRVAANGKIVATEEWRLAKNLDSAQGTNLREPRMVTPTNAELIHKIEIAKGMEKVGAARKEFGIGGARNIAVAKFEIEGIIWERFGHSGKLS